MRKIILLVFSIILNLQLSIKADDIRDFEIEGMSVGDSLLSYFTEKQIKKKISGAQYPNKEFILYYFKNLSSFNTYEAVTVAVKANDKNYIIHDLGGSIYLGSYIFYSNLDYRLVFLFLTIPFAYNFGKKINLVYCLSILIISNSWIFHFKPLSLEHIIFTSILYGIKLSLVIFISYYLGVINKNFFNIKKVELF